MHGYFLGFINYLLLWLLLAFLLAGMPFSVFAERRHHPREFLVSHKYVVFSYTFLIHSLSYVPFPL